MYESIRRKTFSVVFKIFIQLYINLNIRKLFHVPMSFYYI